MISVQKMKCNCGKCGAKFLVEWNTPFIDISDGQYMEYLNNGDWECPHCTNLIYGTLYVCKSIDGTLNSLEIRDVYDSKNTGKSTIQ